MDQIPAPALPLLEWLREARTHYLNFLRNLTPQVFLASMALITGSKLNFLKFDFGNFWPTFAFFSFVFLFFYAAYANISIFFAELFPGLVPWARQQQKQLHESGVPRFRIPLLFLRAMYKEKRLLELGLAVCAIFMLQVVFAGVVATSIASATTFIRATKL